MSEFRLSAMTEEKRFYALATLPAHLAEAGQYDRLVRLLTDLRFVEAKCAAGLVYDLEADYDLALAVLPEAQQELEQARAHQQEIARYTQALIKYAQAWSEARARYARDPANYPMPAPEAIPLPTLASMRPWTDAEIRADSERIIHEPTRLDRLRAFASFVRAESHHLVQFATLPGFCVQHAYNYADAGPVVSAAEQLLKAEIRNPLLLQKPAQHAQRAAYTPHPALLKTLTGHTNRVASVSITPDGHLAISGSADGTVRVWDLSSGELLHTLEGHTSVESVSVTPDGHRAISGSDDRTVRVWDLSSGKLLHTLEGLGGGSVSITPDGRLAISGSGDGSVRLWDLSSGELLRTLKGHEKMVNSVSITPDGRRAVSGNLMHGTVQVWDLSSGKLLHTLVGHTPGSNSISVNVTPDGRLAVSGSGDGTVRLWDLCSGEALRTLKSHANVIQCISITPDGCRAVSGDVVGIVRVWDLSTGESFRTVMGQLARHTVWIDSISFTPDGRLAVSGSIRDGAVRVWDLSSGKLLYTLKGHTNGINSVRITPDGRLAISGSGDIHHDFDDRDYTVRVWDLSSGELLHTLKGHTNEVKSVGITPDGRLAISGSFDGSVRLWDLSSGELLHTLEGPSYVASVSITPDGCCVVSGSWDETIRLWDLSSGKLLHTLEGHTSSVKSVSVTPDGRRAISGSDDRTVRVWDLSSGQLLAVFPAPDDVSSLSEIIAGGHLGIATQLGQTVVVTLQNIPLAPPLITAVRLWLAGAECRWDNELTAHCAQCGQLFAPPPDVLKTIHRLTVHLALDHSPCLELPPEDWDEPGLSSQCPHCHQSVHFNPFVLDQRDRVWSALPQEVPAGPVPGPLPPKAQEGKTSANVVPPPSLPPGAPERVVREARSWLMSTLLWVPLIIANLGYCLGTLPTPLHFDRSLAWAALVGLTLAWVTMGAQLTLSERSSRGEGLALAGTGAVIAAGVLMVGLFGNPLMGLVGLGLVGVAVGVVAGAAGGLASPRGKHLAGMADGLAVSWAPVGAYVAAAFVAQHLGGSLLGWAVGIVAGLVALVVALLVTWLVAWLLLKIVQGMVKLGPAGGVLIGLVGWGLLAWLGQIRLGEVIALVAGLAYSLAVGIAGVMQKKSEGQDVPRLGWGLRIAVVVSLLVLIWICLLGSWPLQVR